MAREEKRAEWAGVVALWRESGLGKAALCREYRVKSWQFRYWCRRLAADGGGREAAADGFVRLRFPDEAGDGAEAPMASGGDPESCGLTLVVRDVRVELAADFDEAVLARVLRVLEQHGTTAC